MITTTEPPIGENIFACLFIAHNAINLSRHEQGCLMSKY